MQSIACRRWIATRQFSLAGGNDRADFIVGHAGPVQVSCKCIYAEESEYQQNDKTFFQTNLLPYFIFFAADRKPMPVNRETTPLKPNDSPISPKAIVENTKPATPARISRIPMIFKTLTSPLVRVVQIQLLYQGNGLPFTCRHGPIIHPV